MTKINRTFRLDKELNRALDKICVRYGDKTYHIEQALSNYGPIKVLIEKEKEL